MIWKPAPGLEISATFIVPIATAAVAITPPESVALLKIVLSVFLSDRARTQGLAPVRSFTYICRDSPVAEGLSFRSPGFYAHQAAASFTPALMNESRSWLIRSACVVGIP